LLTASLLGAAPADAGRFKQRVQNLWQRARGKQVVSAPTSASAPTLARERATIIPEPTKATPPVPATPGPRASSPTRRTTARPSRPDALKRVAEGPARSGTPRWGTPRSKEIFRTTTGRGDAPGQPVRTILFLHGAGQDADTQVVKHLIAGLDHAGVPSRIVS